MSIIIINVILNKKKIKSQFYLKKKNNYVGTYTVVI